MIVSTGHMHKYCFTSQLRIRAMRSKQFKQHEKNSIKSGGTHQKQATTSKSAGPTTATSMGTAMTLTVEGLPQHQRQLLPQYQLIQLSLPTEQLVVHEPTAFRNKDLWGVAFDAHTVTLLLFVAARREGNSDRVLWLVSLRRNANISD